MQSGIGIALMPGEKPGLAMGHSIAVCAPHNMLGETLRLSGGPQGIQTYIWEISPLAVIWQGDCKCAHYKLSESIMYSWNS